MKEAAPLRVTAFIDGFNLYHAIDDSGLHHLKWCDLRRLCKIFAPDPQYDLTDVLFFSAYATWRPASYKRHREYVKALEVVGVTPMMAKFKSKYRKCYSCGNEWEDHEEKETDVAIAAHIVMRAFKDLYDRALIVSSDSDLVPAVSLVREQFPDKPLRIIAPPFRRYSMDLMRAVGGKESCRQIKTGHLERSRLPREVSDRSGKVVAIRPEKYDPS